MSPLIIPVDLIFNMNITLGSDPLLIHLSLSLKQALFDLLNQLHLFDESNQLKNLPAMIG